MVWVVIDFGIPYLIWLCDLFACLIWWLGFSLLFEGLLLGCLNAALVAVLAVLGWLVDLLFYV